MKREFPNVNTIGWWDEDGTFIKNPTYEPEYRAITYSDGEWRKNFIMIDQSFLPKIAAN